MALLAICSPRDDFTGNRGAYYDWRNSCLDRVIATRTGIPISLSVLMIEVARRVGCRLRGVGMPAHFLVTVADESDVFFDPFDGGRRLDRARGSVAVRARHRRTGRHGASTISIPHRTETS